MTINTLAIPFPDFKFNETINPEEFDSNNSNIQAKINEIIGLLNSVNTTTGSTMITDSVGSVKINLTDTSKSILEELVQIGTGFHTFYAVGGSRDLPGAGVSIRGFAHRTSLTTGYVIAMDYRNGLYTNYYDSNSVGWLGWSGTFQNLTLANSWVNYGTGETNAQYTKSGSVCTLRGIIKSGTITVGTTLFTLPVGFRPNSLTYATTQCSGNTIVRLKINTDGTVQLFGGTVSNAWLQLDGVSFVCI